VSDPECVPAGLTGFGPIIPHRLAYPGAWVWHYTDASGLIGLASGGPHGNGRLWATAATILNDPDELAYGADIVLRWFESNGLEDMWPDTSVKRALMSVLPGLKEWILANPAYVVCASKDPDSLVNWRGYAGSGGYAVELSTLLPADFPDGSFTPVYSLVGRPDPETSFSLAPTWVAVAYTAEQQFDLINGVVEYMFDETTLVGRVAAMDSPEDTEILVRGLLSGVASTLKDPKFRSENEVRLIAFPHESMRPNFRGTARGVVPYLEIEVVEPSPGVEPPMPLPLPIADLWIGPPRGEAMDQRARTVDMLMMATGRRTRASKSKIPFIP
jgi:hypothetical protein